MAIRVLEETGLLPHLNPGVMTLGGDAAAQAGRAVDGDDAGDHLDHACSSPAGAHFGSPDKDPAVRLRVLEDAGRVHGPVHHRHSRRHRRDARERAESLFAIRTVARQYGAIQEVIVQNFLAKPDTAMRARRTPAGTSTWPRSPSPGWCSAPGCASRRRPTCPSPQSWPGCWPPGIDDWGGVSPLTPDHVNPERPWPHIDELRRVTAAAGFTLRERLTAHPSTC